MWVKSFGLGIIQGWLWLFFLNGPLLYNTTAKFGGRPETVFMTFLLFNSLSFLLIAKISKKFSSFVKKPLLIVLSMSLITAGTLMAGLAAKDLYMLSYNQLVTLGSVMSGFGSTMLIAAWGERFSTLPAHQASLAFGIAVTIGTVIFFVINLFPLSVAVPITAFIPLVSMVLLLREAGTAAEPENDAPIRQPVSFSFPFPTRLIVLIILFYLTGGLMYKMIASGQQLGFYENFWLTNIVYFAVCLSAGGIVYFNPSLDLRFLYRPILPLLGVGFVLFPALHSSYPVVPFTFLQAGFALFDLYTWILFAYLAARHRFPVSVIAWGMFVITSAIFAGELLFTGIFSALMVNMKEMDLVSLLAALLMFTGTMVFRGERETFAGWDYPSNPVKPKLYETSGSDPAIKEIACTSSNEINSNSITEKAQAVRIQLDADQTEMVQVIKENLPVEKFALQYNLTPRETQILVLLLEGRNNPYIRENLNVSNNTLKTHLRNMYRKLSISDRQELLDLYKVFKDNLFKDNRVRH